MPSTGTRAVRALRAAGVAYALHEFALPQGAGSGRDARPSYGLDSAAALGVEPERLLKTLVALVDGSPVLAIVPVATELDLGALAAAVQGRRAEMADRVQAERLTGYLVGGISPLGCCRPLPVVVDESALLHKTILLSAGSRSSWRPATSSGSRAPSLGGSPASA